MLFNSLEFVVFLPIVFGIYWLISSKRVRSQNLFLMVASYIFYGWWDWRFLSLILFSTCVDYIVGRQLNTQNDPLKRKILFWISVSVNLGFLGFFKYYNFFVDNFVAAFTFLGNEIQAGTLNIILPVGISFYTFQTLSYTIDVYRRKIEPTKDFIAFSAYVSFFPQLVAGPIERASHLLPQFKRERYFDYTTAMDGMRQILWGMFKKVVIADNCAHVANYVFANTAESNGSALVLGALFFTFQIYGDFSGYSDIAIGTARLFGFRLMRNFAFPYFSRDIAEFWRRWHISLSTWFRDYLYIPLGGSRVGRWMQIRNVFIVFIVSGFWHGANWTFILWSALNALFFLPLLLTDRNRNHLSIVAKGKILPSTKEFFSMFGTFAVTVFAWIFFRAENLSHAFIYISGIISASIFEWPTSAHIVMDYITIGLIFFFMILEWIGRESDYALRGIAKLLNVPFRIGLYYLLIYFILIYGQFNENQFIYFQF